MMENPSLCQTLKGKVARYHERTPGLRRFPLPAVAIILGLGLANALIWAAVGVILV